MVIVANAVVAFVATLWAYSAYRYNWLNVGGGIGKIEIWSSMSSVMPYVALLVWGFAIFFAIVVGRVLHLSIRQRLLYAVGSVGIGPFVFIAADWFFHRGFPPSPL